LILVLEKMMNGTISLCELVVLNMPQAKIRRLSPFFPLGFEDVPILDSLIDTENFR